MITAFFFSGVLQIKNRIFFFRQKRFCSEVHIVRLERIRDCIFELGVTVAGIIESDKHF